MLIGSSQCDVAAACSTLWMCRSIVTNEKLHDTIRPLSLLDNSSAHSSEGAICQQFGIRAVCGCARPD